MPKPWLFQFQVVPSELGPHAVFRRVYVNNDLWKYGSCSLLFETDIRGYSPPGPSFTA